MTTADTPLAHRSPFDLTGSVALVVGAGAGGIGGSAARTLVEHGAAVAVADLPARGAALEETVAACGGRPSVHTCDVTDPGSVEGLLDDVVRRHAAVDVLVNAAGVMLRKDFASTTPEEWRAVIDVNLTGTWLLNRAAGRRMADRGCGRIVNVSTVYAERVGPVPESAYYASKAGVANLTRAMAAELGGCGVTVNCLAPGVFYPTNMTSALDQERRNWFAARTMLGRLGDPDVDLAGPLLLLASPASGYMTGQVVYVDGGWSAW